MKTNEAIIKIKDWIGVTDITTILLFIFILLAVIIIILGIYRFVKKKKTLKEQTENIDKEKEEEVKEEVKEPTSKIEKEEELKKLTDGAKTLREEFRESYTKIAKDFNKLSEDMDKFLGDLE